MVGGIIDSDVRWEAENGPFIVTRDILVTPTGRLTITPGTRILMRKPLLYDDTIDQLDGVDSQQVAIRVQGMIRCIGRAQNRIVFTSYNPVPHRSTWYGIVIENPPGDLNEIAYTDIQGATWGLTVRTGTILVRNTLFEHNNTALRLLDGGNARIVNCVITRSFAAAAVVAQSNPTFLNSIIAFNNNLGIWCDGVSRINATYNCFFDNPEGAFLDCDPALGKLKRARQGETDSTDGSNNLFRNPVFRGSAAELALTAGNSDNRHHGHQPPHPPADGAQRYQLSAHSPCRNSAHPGREYRNSDNSRGDMGIFGGQEFFSGGR